MDRQKSLLNISVSVFFRILTIIASIFVKRLLIRTCGNEVNGLNALFLSIIGFLSVAEIGVGGAITFCMYKPIVEKDNDKVSALYHLFNRIYTFVGIFILCAGLVVMPFLKHFAKDYAQLDVNMHLAFVLILASSVLSYLFGAKTSLINAYKNNYKTTAISSGGILLQYALQIVVLFSTASFAAYLVCKIIAVLVQWLVTSIIARKDHSDILKNRQRIDAETKKHLLKHIKAMFMHKIGGILVNTVDSIVISAFVGVVALGNYSNYTAILTSMTSVIGLVFSSLISIFGHLYVEKSKDAARKYCDFFHILNFMLGTIFFLGYYAIIDNLVAILFSAELVSAKSISFVITMNGFVQYMRQSALSFRDATGTFYYDRWKPLYEGILNIVLSILLVKVVGVVGVILATIITNLLICHIMEPYVLYKHGFSASPRNYFLRNYILIAVFTAALLVLDHFMRDYSAQWKELLVNGFISACISLIICTTVLIRYRELFSNVIHEKRNGGTETI